MATTVKQQPLSAMLSPMASSPAIRGSIITIRTPGDSGTIAATSARLSTKPVNTRGPQSKLKQRFVASAAILVELPGKSYGRNHDKQHAQQRHRITADDENRHQGEHDRHDVGEAVLT